MFPTPADLSLEQRRQVGLTRAYAPTACAIRRLLQRLDADLLDALLGAYMWTRTAVVHGRRVIAIDGKTVRGARTSSTPAPHLVAALDHTTGTVLGQLATAVKSNEIPAVRTLLATFDLSAEGGVVVTVDALCRARHNASYADLVVMPTGPAGPVGGVGIGFGRSA